MFKELTGKQAKKLHAVEGKISGVPVVPSHHVDVMNAKRELEGIVTGRVNPKWAKEELIALEYAKTHFHFQTKSSLIADLKAEKRIVFHNYI